MRAVGNMRHENIVPLRVYSEVDEIVVYDYYSQGSVSDLLYGKQGEKRIPLDWESRVRIAIGAARGIAHLHEKSTVHGNIKTSNIFLNSQQYGCVCNVGLIFMMSPRVILSPGYRAPEVRGNQMMSLASDVYSFGVLLLELLTGKSPVKSPLGIKDFDLVRWVNSIVSESGSRIRDVFDLDLLRDPKNEKGLVKMMQIGLKCVASVSWQRPEIMEVVKRLEDIETVSSQNNHGDSREVYRRHSYNVPPAPSDMMSSFGKEIEMEEEEESRFERRHSYNGATAGSGSIFDESVFDDEFAMERPPPLSDQVSFSGFQLQPPDYDDLAARFEALKYFRSHSYNAAPAGSDSEFDESNVDDEIEMERPRPLSNQELFSGFHPQPPDDGDDLVARFNALKYDMSHSYAAPQLTFDDFDSEDEELIFPSRTASQAPLIQVFDSEDELEMALRSEGAASQVTLMPEKQVSFSRVHPKLPDYDAFVARLKALRDRDSQL